MLKTTSQSETNIPEMAPKPDQNESDGEKVSEEPPVDENYQEDDPETAELARLRCESVRTEEKRGPRSNRCADYPGLAFGSAMFGSDTMMKFNIIKNELHNIMRSQLKRVDGEVSALAQRIKALDDNLALSEQYIKTATTTLSEALQYQREQEQDKEDDSPLSQFDAQMALLGHRLLHAKMLAAEVAGDDVSGTQSDLESSRVDSEFCSDPNITSSAVTSKPDSIPSIHTPTSTTQNPSGQGLPCSLALSAPPVTAPQPLRRPFSTGPTQ